MPSTRSGKQYNPDGASTTYSGCRYNVTMIFTKPPAVTPKPADSTVGGAASEHKFVTKDA